VTSPVPVELGLSDEVSLPNPLTLELTKLDDGRQWIVEVRSTVNVEQPLRGSLVFTVSGLEFEDAVSLPYAVLPKVTESALGAR